MKPLQVYIPEDLHRQLKQKALDMNISVSDIVREALERGGSVELPKKEFQAEKPAETCPGHDMKWDCGRKGCKYA